MEYKTVKEAKEQEYINCIVEHIANVQKAFKNIKSSEKIMEILKNASTASDPLYMQALENSIKDHDKSKFGPEEFDAYRIEYYPVDDSEKKDNKSRMDNAWKHHYTLNKHHWDSWKACPNLMPLNCVVEMICDWCAMSMKFGGKTIDWYNKQQNIILGAKQKKIVEKVLLVYNHEFEI